MKNKGWRNNSHNHKMASKGVKTKLDKFAINNILYNSSDPYLSNLKIKYAYKLDKNKYLLVATSLNSEDSNLRLCFNISSSSSLFFLSSALLIIDRSQDSMRILFFISSMLLSLEFRLIIFKCPQEWVFSLFTLKPNIWFILFRIH